MIFLIALGIFFAFFAVVFGTIWVTIWAIINWLEKQT